MRLSLLFLACSVCAASLCWRDVRYYEWPAFYRITTATNMNGPFEYWQTITNAATNDIFRLPIFLNEPARFYNVHRFYRLDKYQDSIERSWIER